MAKQAGKYRFRGSIDGLCFYKMNGEYYVRLRSSLTGKQFWKRKAFEGSRKSCKRFGGGNKLASKVYRMIEKEKREYALFCFLKKRAIFLLKEGINIEQVEVMLIDYVFDFGLIDTCSLKYDKAINTSELVIFCYSCAMLNQGELFSTIHQTEITLLSNVGNGKTHS